MTAIITQEYLKETILYAFFWSVIVFLVTIITKELTATLSAIIVAGAQK